MAKNDVTLATKGQARIRVKESTTTLDVFYMETKTKDQLRTFVRLDLDDLMQLRDNLNDIIADEGGRKAAKRRAEDRRLAIAVGKAVREGVEEALAKQRAADLQYQADLNAARLNYQLGQWGRISYGTRVGHDSRPYPFWGM